MQQRRSPKPQPLAPVSPWWSRPLVLSLLLAAGTLAVYWPVVRFDFVNLDDQVYVTERPEVLAGLTASGVQWALSATEGGAWHPLTWWSLMLDGEWSGHRAGGYHTTNLLLHALNTLLLFAWLRAATKATGRSAVVAALFALHPLHVESVAWISERKDVLSTTFWLLSLLAYGAYTRATTATTTAGASTQMITGRAARFYGLTLLCFTLGLMSKPMLVTLPFALLLLDYWPLQRAAPLTGATLWRLFREKIPFFLLSASASVVAVWSQRVSDAIATLEWISPLDRIGNALVAYCRYLGKTFWPVDLAVFYPHPTTWPLLAVLSAAALLLVVSALAIRWRTRAPFFLVGWCWFLGTLVPVIGLVQVGGQSLADRYTYVPLIGCFLAVVWGAATWLRTGPRATNASPVLITMAGMTLVVCAVLTTRQLRHWQNSESLFRHALAVTDNNIVAHVNLASTLLDQNRFDEAAEQCRRALALRPDSPDALKNLGLALAGSGQWSEAVAQYQRALEINPKDDQVLNSLGLAFANQGKLTLAEDHFRRALEHHANSPEAWSNLGLTLAFQARTPEAIDCYHRALQLKPGEVKVLNNLGLALATQQRWDEALACYRQALDLRPDSVDALVNAGAALGSQGKVTEAIASYRRALEIKPDSLEARFNLGIALVNLGQRAEGIQHLRAARELQPNNAAVLNQLRELEATPDLPPALR